jgi:hypothetical protein
MQCTVEELLTGEKRPISMAEYQNWNTFYKVRAVLEKQGQH